MDVESEPQIFQMKNGFYIIATKYSKCKTNKKSKRRYQTY